MTDTDAAAKEAKEAEKAAQRAELIRRQQLEKAKQLQAQQRAQLLHMVTTIGAGVVRSYPHTVDPRVVTKRTMAITMSLLGAVEGLLAGVPPEAEEPAAPAASAEVTP